MGVITGVEVLIGVAVDVLVSKLPGVGVFVDVGLGAGVLSSSCVGNGSVPRRLVLVGEMETLEGVAVGDGVALGPVTGIKTADVAVSTGIGVEANWNKDGFVGVKKSRAKASCVNARSAGVAVAVTCG